MCERIEEIEEIEGERGALKRTPVQGLKNGKKDHGREEA